MDGVFHAGRESRAFASGRGFDGRLIYYPPFNPSGESLRFATHRASYPPRPASWARPTCTTSMAPSPVGYVGGHLDGASVFRSDAYDTGTGSCSVTTCKGRSRTRLVVVFDTQSSTTTPAALSGWPSTGGTCNFLPGATFEQHRPSATHAHYPLRTRASFTDATSWTIFDALKLSRRRIGARLRRSAFVYFLRATTSRADVFLRYDTKADFASSSSGPASASGRRSSDDPFMGGVLDGRYLYLVPTATGDVGRALRHDRRVQRGRPRGPLSDVKG